MIEGRSLCNLGLKTCLSAGATFTYYSLCFKPVKPGHYTVI